MAKVFFSYSWAQEELVTNVGNALGRDFVNQDKYNFEVGNDLSEEMKQKISKSDLFVIFLSKQSLYSPNVRLELDYVLPLVVSEMISFCPILIDEELEISSDWRKYSWIKKYLMHLSKNEKNIERLIRQKIRRIIGTKLGLSGRFFIGRDEEKSQITKNYFYSVDNTRRALIVSGLPKIGRKSLIVDTLITKLDTSLDKYYEPIIVSLAHNDSIDLLVEQLGEFSDKINVNEELKKGRYEETLITILNELREQNQKILIDDKECIVSRNGNIVDWFRSIILNESLIPYTYFFIASQFSVDPNIDRNMPQIQTFRLGPLSKSDMRLIFTAYAKEKKVKCSSENTEYYINHFNGYPQLILNVVDDIAKADEVYAKRYLANNIKIYDSSNFELMNSLSEDKDAYQLCIVLSRFEFVSYDILCELFPNMEIGEKLEKLYYLSLYEQFGSARQYYRLNRNLSEFISRNNIKLDEENERTLSNFTSQVLSNMDDSYLDLSDKLFQIKEQIKKNPDTISSEKLLPSYALNVIVELYNKKEYEEVRTLSLRLINENQHQIYDSVSRAVRYWLCLACARLQDRDNFEKTLDYFYSRNKKENATFCFLRGFYYRFAGNPRAAQNWYEKAIKYDCNLEQTNHLAKVHHELALVYMMLDDPRALELAKRNYELAKENTYHIESYFRCLVRSENPDKEILMNLIQRMKGSYDIYKDAIVETFNAEYDYYINGNYQEAIRKLKQIIDDYPNSTKYPKDALDHMLKDQRRKNN